MVLYTSDRKKYMRGSAGNPEEKAQLGIPGHRFLGNIIIIINQLSDSFLGLK
jgi:hypothetical protein